MTKTNALWKQMLLYMEKVNLWRTRMHSGRMHTAHSSSHWGRGVCLSACWDRPPWVWAWRPPNQIPLNFPLGVGLDTPWPDPPQLPWVWAWRPPSQIPSTSPLHVGLETCKACWDTTHPHLGDLLHGHAGIPAAMHAGIPPPPPVNRMTDRCKKMTLPQTLFAGGNYSSSDVK